ncbi:hypothetical protein M407DRAFT_27685 [Tulasnella calospora MUT 4182]|uniref:Uncharacterized protein n=1 Tax=Tulasnella calospora MUT 4182 TaxID=1051891 RepID=A0A0C3Q2R0_9AGAM|nr:hypothetical protein M407DRAFT_27685 [Tulasnella calospora MUT 4182]
MMLGREFALSRGGSWLIRSGTDQSSSAELTTSCFRQGAMRIPPGVTRDSVLRIHCVRKWLSTNRASQNANTTNASRPSAMPSVSSDEL